MKALAGRRWRLDDGPYAFGERAELRISGTGTKTVLWVGISSVGGKPDCDRCLGVLPYGFLEQLVIEASRRIAKAHIQPPPAPGAAATMVRPERGRRR